eukprot:6461835-Amphidinium_carterae.3
MAFSIMIIPSDLQKVLILLLRACLAGSNSLGTKRHCSKCALSLQSGGGLGLAALAWRDAILPWNDCTNGSSKEDANQSTHLSFSPA